MPLLNTYKLRTSDSDHFSTKTDFEVSETIETGSNFTIPVKNCIIIGNIYGKNYIGGILGSEDPATSYKAITHSVTYSNYNFSLYVDGQKDPNFRTDGDLYLWENDKFTGISATFKWDELTFSYKTYSCNNTNSAITDCSYSGSLYGDTWVGGIAGCKNGGVIARNVAYCKINANSEVGGIAGTILGDGTRQTTDSIQVVSNVAICPSIIPIQLTQGLSMV